VDVEGELCVRRWRAGWRSSAARLVQYVQVAFDDDPVHVRVEQVQTRRGAPVPEPARLDVLGAQQRVVQQLDLPTGR
jgi:hypothetical protein